MKAEVLPLIGGLRLFYCAGGFDFANSGYFTTMKTCSLCPVTDDMAMCHPEVQMDGGSVGDYEAFLPSVDLTV